MTDRSTPIDPSTVYLTADQIHKLGGLAVDTMIGIQIHTDASDESYLTCEFVDVDSKDLRHFTIYADGKMVETT